VKIQKHLYLPAILLMAAIIAGLVPSIASAEETVSQLTISITANKTNAYTGDNVTFTYIVTNTGVSAVDNLTITDNRTGAIVLTKSSLSIGENATGTAVYTVKATDLPGPLLTSVLAAGVTAAGENVTAAASVSVALKAADIDDDDEDKEDDDDADNDHGSTNTKADVLKGRGVPGKGIDHAPGLQKPFNDHSQTANNAGGHEKNEGKHGNGHGGEDD
jgi:uncharacterized repeat protein (TIGR01451 family)